MRVVLAARNVLPFHSFCGTGRYVHGLAKHLVKLGASVDVVAPPEKEARPPNDSADGIGYHFIAPQVRGGGFFGFYRSYLRHNINASRFISRKDFDVLHIFEINAFPYLHEKNRRPAVVSPFHRGTEPWKEGNSYARLLEAPIDLPLAYCMKKCDAVASEGPAQTKRLMEEYHLKKEKVFELPDGVDLELIREYTSNPELGRRDVGLSEDDFVLISVGRIDPMKGVHYLIEAFDEVQRQAPDARLILVGEGSDEEKIRNMIRERGIEEKVAHVKNVSDRQLYSYYSMADAFVTPTLYEGLPQVVLEAMACGLPVIATETGENTQVVEDGVNGLLVPPAKPDEMAAAALKLHDTGKKGAFGAESSRKIRAYDWKITAGKAIKEYEKLAA